MVRLSLSRVEASQKLSERIAAGNELLVDGKKIASEQQYEQWKLIKARWVSFTSEALGLIYESGDQAKEFNHCFVHMVWVASTWPDHLRDDRRDVEHAVNVLTSLEERLALAGEPGVDLPPTRAGDGAPSTGKPVVFLVHGRDIGTREKIARFLEKAGDNAYNVVILDEQATGGLTLIEKFERHAGDARYAVVLVTGDDVGSLKGQDLKPRARQNVVFELGFFFGKLGRANVAVLYDQDVEKPTDVDGVGYISLAEDWQQRLVRELKNVGLDFSLDRLN